MKIIMTEKTTSYGSSGHVTSAVVHLSGTELAWIVNGNGHDHVLCDRAWAGANVEISKRMFHLLHVESQIAEAVALSQKLRTLAEMLEMNHPAIEAVVTTPGENAEV